MKKVFVDTSALVAFFDRKDFYHTDSARLFENIKKEKIKMLITNYIFDECVTTILSRVGHNNAVRAGEFILNSKIIEMIWLDEANVFKAWDFF